MKGALRQAWSCDDNLHSIAQIPDLRSLRRAAIDAAAGQVHHCHDLLVCRQSQHAGMPWAAQGMPLARISAAQRTLCARETILQQLLQQDQHG